MSGTVSIESISFRNTLPMVLQQQQVTTPQWIRNLRSLPAAFANPGATLRLTVKLTSRTSRHAVRLRNRRVGGGLAAVGAMPEGPSISVAEPRRRYTSRYLSSIAV